MAKESNVKENPVSEALRKLKEEEAELIFKLKPLQEAIVALEKIVDKTVKKAKPVASGKDSAEEVLSFADVSDGDSNNNFGSKN